MTHEDTAARAAAYRKYERLIYKECYRFLRSMQGRRRGRGLELELDDVLSEAHIAFMHALDGNWDDTKGKFTTWLVRSIRNRFVSKFCRVSQQARSEAAVVHPEQLDRLSKPEPSNSIDLFDALSTEAAEVMHLILDMPDELADIHHSRGARDCGIRKAVRTYLVARGWPLLRVKKVFAEIKTVMEEAVAYNS